ncbi:Imm50 family immunity protein [Streptomyces fumanus]|uniref:Imm50 family immunity protein n=1 Tax=Streptomyces fumanus TaxID=67302 RepID=UPI00340EDC97
MSVSDWTHVLRHGGLTDLYEDPPAPDLCQIFYVHIDERGDSVTLGFSTNSLPTTVPLEWQEQEYNTVEFFLTFSKIADLKVTDWGPSCAQQIDVARGADERFDVRLGSTRRGISFTSPSVELTRKRAYLAAHTE